MKKCNPECSCAKNYLMAAKAVGEIVREFPPELTREHVLAGRLVDREEVANWLAFAFVALACMMTKMPDAEVRRVCAGVFNEMVAQEIEYPLFCKDVERFKALNGLN